MFQWNIENIGENILFIFILFIVLQNIANIGRFSILSLSLSLADFNYHPKMYPYLN